MKATIAFSSLVLFAPLAAQASGQVPHDGTILTGLYAGSYLCQDGEHGLYLDIAALTATEGGFSVSGVLGFFPVIGGADGQLAHVAGSFTVSGMLSKDGVIALEADEWLVEPQGYGAAALEGVLSERPDGLWQIEGKPVLPGAPEFCTDLIATQFLP